MFVVKRIATASQSQVIKSRIYGEVLIDGHVAESTLEQFANCAR
jgi:hypothetical protein